MLSIARRGERPHDNSDKWLELEASVNLSNAFVNGGSAPVPLAFRDQVPTCGLHGALHRGTVKGHGLFAEID